MRLLVAMDASEVSPDIAIEVSDEIRDAIARSEQAIKSADLAEAALLPRLERLHAELAKLEPQTIDRQTEKGARSLTSIRGK